MPQFVSDYTTPSDYTLSDSSAIEVANNSLRTKPIAFNTANIAHYRCDEGSYNNVVDELVDAGPMANHAQGEGTPGSFQVLGADLAISLTGSNAFRLPADAGVTANGTFTIDCWVNTTTASRGVLYSCGSTTNGNPFVILDVSNASAGDVKFLVRDDAASNIGIIAAPGGMVNDGAWHHILAEMSTYTGPSSNNMKLYIDNALVAQASEDFSGLAFTFDSTYIGLYQVGSTVKQNYYVGKINEIGVWNRVLTSTEKASRYNNGVAQTFTTYSPNDEWGYLTTGFTDTAVVDITGAAATLSSGSVSGRDRYQWSTDGLVWNYSVGGAETVATKGNWDQANTLAEMISFFGAGTQQYTTFYLLATFRSFLASPDIDDDKLISLESTQISYTTNQTPIVGAGVDFSVFDGETTNVAPNATFSDPDIGGSIVTVEYKVDNETAGYINVPIGGFATLQDAMRDAKHTFSISGQSTVRVRVTDDQGATAEDVLIVTVNKYIIIFSVTDGKTGAHLTGISFDPGDGAATQNNLTSPFNYAYDNSNGTPYDALFSVPGYPATKAQVTANVDQTPFGVPLNTGLGVLDIPLIVSQVSTGLASNFVSITDKLDPVYASIFYRRTKDKLLKKMHLWNQNKTQVTHSFNYTESLGDIIEIDPE